MEQDTFETPVLFRMEGGRGEPWSCVAVFPTVPGFDPYDVAVYAHVGQHGSAHRGWYNATRKATPEEFAGLKRELESAPYGYRLKVCQRWTRRHDDARRAEWKRISQ